MLTRRVSGRHETFAVPRKVRAFASGRREPPREVKQREDPLRRLTVALNHQHPALGHKLQQRPEPLRVRQEVRRLTQCIRAGTPDAEENRGAVRLDADVTTAAPVPAADLDAHRTQCRLDRVGVRVVLLVRAPPAPAAQHQRVVHERRLGFASEVQHFGVS